MKKCAMTKSAISLIVLVITIIVMTILSGTVIIMLSNTNVIGEASKAKIRSDLSSLQDMVGSYVASNYMTIDRKKEYELSDFGINNKEYEDITYIRNGRLYVASSASSDVQEIARELNMLKGVVSSDTGKVDFNDVKLTNIIIRGNSIQDGTPTSANPIEVKSVGEKTKNLFDISSAARGKGLAWTTGAYYNNETAIASDFIKIKNNENYVLKYYAQVILYDKNQEYISSIKGTTPVKSFEITNENCEYIKIAFRTSDNAGVADFNDVNDIQLELGDKATNYEPYGYKIPVKISGKNLLNYNVVEDTNQYIIKTNGKTYTPSSTGGSWRASDYIEVNPNTKYSFNEISATASAAGSAWYDENKNYISGFSATELANSGQVMTSPDNATYLRHSFRIDENYNTNWKNTIMISESGNLVPYENYVEPIITTIYLDEPLRKIGDYTDYIDIASKKVVRNIKEKILSKNDNLKVMDRGVFYTETSNIVKPASTQTLPLVMCSHYVGTEWAYTMPSSATKEGVCINSSSFLVGFYDSVNAISVEKFNTFLNSNKVKLYYALSSPVAQAINLPTISNPNGTFSVTIMTSVKPSNLQVEYK